MPWDGAWWLQEYKGRKIGANCHRCGLKGVWEADELLKEYGSYRMTDLIDTIAITNCCTRLDNHWYDRCGLSYDQEYLLVDPAELNIERSNAAAPAFDGLSLDSTLDDLMSWHRLSSHCLLCGKLDELSIRYMQRRFGRFAKIRPLNSQLKCQACKMPGGMVIRVHKLKR